MRKFLRKIEKTVFHIFCEVKNNKALFITTGVEIPVSIIFEQNMPEDGFYGVVNHETHTEEKAVLMLIPVKEVVLSLGELFEVLNVRNNIKYGCHCGIDDGETPDKCYIDHPEHTPNECIHIGRDSSWKKEDCRFWQRIE